MRKVLTRPIRSLLCITLIATGMLISNAATASAEPVSRTFTVSLPDLQPLFLSLEDEEGEEEVINRDGALNQTLEIVVTADTASDVSIAPASCKGKTVDQRLGLVVGGDTASVVITRYFTPVDKDGVAGAPTSEVLVSQPIDIPQSTRAINVCGGV